MRQLASGAAIALVLATPAFAQDDRMVIGVSIPAATHGWAGGMNYFAQAAIERLSETYPNLEFALATASDPGQQVNDIEDRLTQCKSLR